MNIKVPLLFSYSYYNLFTSSQSTPTWSFPIHDFHLHRRVSSLEVLWNQNATSVSLFSQWLCRYWTGSMYFSLWSFWFRRWQVVGRLQLLVSQLQQNLRSWQAWLIKRLWTNKSILYCTSRFTHSIRNFDLTSCRLIPQSINFWLVNTVEEYKPQFYFMILGSTYN